MCTYFMVAPHSILVAAQHTQTLHARHHPSLVEQTPAFPFALKKLPFLLFFHFLTIAPYYPPATLPALEEDKFISLRRGCSEGVVEKQK